MRCGPSVGPRSGWERGLAAGFGGDDACIVPRALRCRRPQAAGVNARPTMQPGTGDNAEATVCRQAQRRAMLTLSRGLCGAASLGGPMKIIGPCAWDSGAPQPPSTCHARRPRLCRPFALYCRAGVHARRGGLRRGDAAVLCKRRTAGLCNAARPGRLAVTRKDIGRARRGTPQSADAASSPYRGAFSGGRLSL